MNLFYSMLLPFPLSSSTTSLIAFLAIEGNSKVVEVGICLNDSKLLVESWDLELRLFTYDLLALVLSVFWGKLDYDVCKVVLWREILVGESSITESVLLFREVVKLCLEFSMSFRIEGATLLGLLCSSTLSYYIFEE